MSKKPTIGLLTGGGDCPGLNAAIRTVVKCAHSQGMQVKGIKKSFNGLWDDQPEIFDLEDHHVDGIQFKGGTILQTCSTGSPFDSEDKEATDKTVHHIKERMKKFGIDFLMVIGGDGTQTIAAELSQRGVPMVGIPKTIDNDLESTELTIGFQTAVEIGAQSIERLQASAEAHERVMILEVMGRDSGHIALHSGIAASAHGILIPEIPYSPEIIAKMIKRRMESGKSFSTIVIAEGAHSMSGEPKFFKTASGREVLRGASTDLAESLYDLTGLEMRSTVLGYIQRGGRPSVPDVILANQYAKEAIDFILQKKFGFVVSLQSGRFHALPYKDVKAKRRYVASDDDFLKTARMQGICMGD